jgi:hypothetical protein
MLDNNLLIELQEYIDIHLNMVVLDFCKPSIIYSSKSLSEEMPNIDDFIKNKRMPTFNQVLFSFIDKKGVSDSDIYKRAGIDRRHFSKIRSNPDYRLRKNTAIALALAIELDKKETDKLLSAAGYSLSDSDTFDLVIQFCVEKNIYDIHNVNKALDYFSLKPLIGVLE